MITLTYNDLKERFIEASRKGELNWFSGNQMYSAEENTNYMLQLANVIMKKDEIEKIKLSDFVHVISEFKQNFLSQEDWKESTEQVDDLNNIKNFLNNNDLSVSISPDFESDKETKEELKYEENKREEQKDEDPTPERETDSNEYIIRYSEVKERLYKSSKNGELNKLYNELSNLKPTQILSKVSKILFNIDDINKIKIDDVRKTLLSLVTDFAPDTLENKNIRLFDTLDNDQRTKEIQVFLVKAYTELKKKIIHNPKDRVKLTYQKRTEEELKKEQENYRNYMNHSNTERLEEKPFEQQTGEPTKDEKTDLNPDTGLRVMPGTGLRVLPEDKKSNQAYLKALKNIAPFALGTAVGLGASVVIPNVTFSVLGPIRIGYSTAKFANKVYSKALGGKPTPIDKFINTKKAEIKEKFGDTKIYAAAKKVNDFLKKREVQWFLNGAAFGYTIGNAFDIKGKIDKLKQANMNKVNVSEKIVNQPLNNANGNITGNINENISINKNHPADFMQPSNAGTNNYDWLNTGENIDLSNVQYGFKDSIQAMGDSNPVNLLTKYASGDNGTFIKSLVLPNGETFTGNIGDLLEKGIDPNTIAARIMNQNGDYAWMNLQDILDAYSNTAGKIR